MVDLKHVGRVKSTGRKCLVAFRTLPGDAFNCLVVPTENLSDSFHDALIQLVESPSGQGSFEFAQVLARAKFPDGSTMLPRLHADGRLVKIPTDQVEMVPNFQTRILLSELNQIIAEQRGVSVQDLAIKDNPSNVEVVDVAQVNDLKPSQDTNEKQSVSMTAEDRAHQLRSEADRLSKQAAALRREAEELVPIKKTK